MLAHSLRTTLPKQFIHYAVCGAVATGVDFITFFILAWLVCPALEGDDMMVRFLGISVQPIDEALRARHFVYASIGAFLFSNLCAYILNRIYVFESGRHRRWMEALLFYAISIISAGLGIGVGWGLITYTGLGTTWSLLAKITSSVLVNFIGRKHIVFRG